MQSWISTRSQLSVPLTISVTGRDFQEESTCNSWTVTEIASGRTATNSKERSLGLLGGSVLSLPTSEEVMEFEEEKIVPEKDLLPTTAQSLACPGNDQREISDRKVCRPRRREEVVAGSWKTSVIPSPDRNLKFISCGSSSAAKKTGTKRDACGNIIFNEDWGYIPGLDYGGRDNNDIRTSKSVRN